MTTTGIFLGVTRKGDCLRQDEENDVGAYGSNTPNGQIIKFQPSMNEAAKTMMYQIMKMNTSSRLEPSMRNLSTFLIDNISFANALDNGHSSSQISGVTLSEVPPTSGQSYMSAESRFPVPSNAISEIMFPPSVNDCVKVNPRQETSKHNYGKETVSPNFSQLQGITLENTISIPDVNFVVSETGNAENLYTMSAALDGKMSIDTDAFSPDHDVENLPDGIARLPRIDDAFWEQFLTASPISGEMDEIDSSPLESGMTSELEQHTGQENGWDKFQHMDHLTK